MRAVLSAAAFFGVATATTGPNPISQVVSLLKDLAKKAEEDAKVEEKSFLKYKCWYKTTTEEKTKSNTEANTRIESLATFIADVESGRIEFTSERKEREAELANILEELQTAKDMHEQQVADGEAAKEEMNAALTALDDAVTTIGGATGQSLLFKKYKIRKVLALGEAMLSNQEARQLEEALQPENKDWEKLNKKAEFKMKYTARSGEIMALLKKMQKTFGKNLSELELKMKRNEESYQKLKLAKEAERDAAKQALSALTRENGVKGMSLMEAKEEKKRLEDQVDADTKLMADMKEIYDQKLAEFKDRKNARAEEQAGLSEAISILYNDDTRDLMKQSFESQGYLFLQNNAMNRKRTAAFKVLGKYVKSKAQLAKITRSLARAGNSIETVITAIEKMLVKLESEGDNDLKKKEQCQADILDNLKEAKRLAVAIDDDLHSITRNDALIEELDGKIKADNETTDKLNEDLKEAKERIEDEEQQMLAAKKDDMAAADAITRAIAALERFYQKKNAAGFLQRSAQEPSDSQAGAPSLGYEGEYGGLKEENTGVVAMLKMVHGDVEKDIKDGQDIYDASFKEYSEYKSKTEDEIQRLADAIAANKETRGNTVEDNEELKGEVSDNRGSLASVQKQITALRQGGCDFMAVNFELRKSNRQAEKDGLQKAKAILEGADFEA